MSSQCLPSSLGPIQFSIQKQMWFEDFQDGYRGGHLRNRTVLEALNLHVASLPPTKFQLNPTYDSEDVENVKN